jgi:hypothetical protein
MDCEMQETSGNSLFVMEIASDAAATAAESIQYAEHIYVVLAGGGFCFCLIYNVKTINSALNSRLKCGNFFWTKLLCTSLKM